MRDKFIRAIFFALSLLGGLTACRPSAAGSVSALLTTPSSGQVAAGVTPTVLPTATQPLTTGSSTPTLTATLTPTPIPTVDLHTLLRSPLPTPPPAIWRTSGITVAVPVVTPAWLVPTSTPTGELFVHSPEFGLNITLPQPPALALQPTPDGVARTAQVPILMYHYVSDPPANADIYRRDLSVTPERFAEHVQRLRAEGYQAISLYTLVEHLTQGAPLPERSVVLTFDDGYRDNYEQAFPILVEAGMTATFFVVTDFIDEQRPGYLTWDMVRTMYAAGMSIESHGRNHVSLRGQTADYLVWQALGSLETIEFEIGTRPRFISYPAGEYDAQTIAIFHSAHYWAGLTTQQGATHKSDDLFTLRRVRIRNTTTADELLRLVALEW